MSPIVKLDFALSLKKESTSTKGTGKVVRYRVIARLTDPTTKQAFTKMVSLCQITSEGKVTYKTPEDFVHSDRTVIAMILLGLSHLEKDNLLDDDRRTVQLDWVDLDSVDRRSTNIQLILSSDIPVRGDQQKVIFAYNHIGKSIGLRGHPVNSIRRISTEVWDTVAQGLAACAVRVSSPNFVTEE